MSTQSTICVIDDQASVRRTICTILEDAGFRTVQASNGREGIRVVQETKPDLVVMDIVMPEQEGLAAIQELKQGSPSIRILAVSGGGIGDASRYLRFATELGADDAMQKPFRPQDIVDRIKRLLPKD